MYIYQICYKKQILLNSKIDIISIDRLRELEICTKLKSILGIQTLFDRNKPKLIWNFDDNINRKIYQQNEELCKGFTTFYTN